MLHCVTTVKDVNPLTNNTSVTHRLSGGAADEEFPYQVSVSKDKGIARYFITYVLS